jgi:hypothetical protein
MEGLVMGNYLFVIRTISKGESLGRAPVSDEILEDLKAMVEKTLQNRYP